MSFEFCCSNLILLLAIDGMAFSNAYFGQGSGFISMDNVGCFGSPFPLQTNLLQCSYIMAVGDGHNEDVGIRCFDSLSKTLQNRLCACIVVDNRFIGDMLGISTLFYLQIQEVVSLVNWGCAMETMLWREGLRSALMVCGALCLMMAGAVVMHRSPVDNWDLQP